MKSCLLVLGVVAATTFASDNDQISNIGLNVVGPFDNKEEAENYAEDNVPDDAVWIVSDFTDPTTITHIPDNENETTQTTGAGASTT